MDIYKSLSTVIPSTVIYFWLGWLIFLVNKIVPKPYMDELFHADQMQRYCAGNFSSWNKKITTPPGLYAVSMAAMKPVSLLLTDNHFLCDVRSLRFVNCLYLPLTFGIIMRLLKTNGTDRRKLPLVALNISTFPVLFFTCILFYTDLLSTASVLLSLLTIRNGSTTVSALCATLAVTVRQTNIVWVAFGPLVHVLKRTSAALGKKAVEKSYDDDDDWEILMEGFRSRPGLTGQILLRNVLQLWPFHIVAAGFFVFAWLNGGLALGDRAAHTVVSHWPQLFYCAAFGCFFGLSFLLNQQLIFRVMVAFRRYYSLILISLVVVLILIHFFTYEHAYLLADNRHYTFYIWRRYFLRHWSLRYLLAPVYLLSFAVIYASLNEQDRLWKCCYFLCVAAVIVPNRLLEFRYFILPYIIWRIHLDVHLQSWKRLIFEFLLYQTINIVTLALFLYRPFTWSHQPNDLQRFMW